MTNLTTLSYPELLAYKQARVQEMLDTGFAEDCRLLAMQWGRTVAIPHRESTLCRSWEVRHPSLSAIIKVTATEAPGPWSSKNGEYIPERTVTVRIGNANEPFGGSAVLYYSAHNPEERWIYVPGLWEKPVCDAIAKVKAETDLAQAQADEKKRLHLLAELHVGENL